MHIILSCFARPYEIPLSIHIHSSVLVAHCHHPRQHPLRLHSSPQKWRYFFEYSSWRNLDWLMVATETAMSRRRRRQGQWATATKATTATADECVCCVCLWCGILPEGKTASGMVVGAVAAVAAAVVATETAMSRRRRR